MSKSGQEETTRTSRDLKERTDSELAHLYHQGNQGNQQVFDELMRRAASAVDSGIQNFGGGNTSLKLRAKLIAAEALKKYDPEKAKQTTPKTWVYNNMPKLSKYRDDRTGVLHIPDSVKRDVRYLTQVRHKILKEDGVAPSLGKLRDRAGMSQKRFEKANKAFKESGSKETEKGDILGFNMDDDRFSSWVDAVYSELDEPGRKIFEGTTGYMKSPVKKKQDLAKELNMSPPAVTSRLDTIQKRLQEFHEN